MSTISTHTPLTRRDMLPSWLVLVLLNFYSHASYEARRRSIVTPETRREISTHTPLTRRDIRRTEKGGPAGRFLLTRLLRGATTHREDRKV